MNNFHKFFLEVLKNEGEYTDDPRDRGGETLYGVSRVYHPDEFDLIYRLWKDGKKNLALDTAEKFYRKEFYNDLYDQLPEKLAFKLFDLSINLGKGKAVGLLQKAVGAKQDGIFGPKTLEACNNVYREFIAEAEAYYKSLDNPVYEKGWLNRLHRELV